MGTKLIAAIIGIFIVAGGIFLATGFFKEKNQPGIKDEPFAISKPWVEVLRANVFELKENGDIERELQTGDELEAGARIKTDKIGAANIYFPDGSVARLDSDTQIILEEGLFDKQSGKISVKITLAVGKVWSKIFELATPDSLWEVKTSNAVATVRGTAFGTIYFNGKSAIIGSENKVKIGIIDPGTKNVIKEKETVISPDKFVEIGDEDILKIKQEKIAMETMVKDAPREILEQVWVQESKKSDSELNQKIESFKEKGLSGEELKEEFKNYIRQKFEEKIIERRSESESGKLKEEQILKLPPETEKKEFNEVKSEEKLIETSGEIKEQEIQGTGILEISPKKLILETKNNLAAVGEGDRIIFAAILLMSDGSRRDITGSVQWQVLGNIGLMEKPGIFLAKLGESIAEAGSAFGSITASWKDQKTGASFLANSPIFKVEAKIEETAIPPEEMITP